MKNLSFLKANNDNFQVYLYIGLLLIFVSILDVFLGSFFKLNITSFLPYIISFWLPLIFGIIGLHLIRIEFSGN